MSVSKIGAGQEAYYLDAVAQGVEDYYLGHGEAPGRWTGSASGLLGLAGQVHADELRAALGGRDPTDGARLIQARKDRVPGFDLTFSAPKSVSVLYGLGDPDTVRAVRAGPRCSPASTACKPAAAPTSRPASSSDTPRPGRLASAMTPCVS